MPPGLLLIILFIIGLFGPVLLFRWLQRRFLGSDDSTGDRIMDYGRGFGDYNWRRWNERQPGAAEKLKPQEGLGGVRPNPSPAQTHIPDTVRLHVDDTSDPVELSSLLPDQKQSRKR